MTSFILYIIGFCFVISGVDYIFGNRFRLGTKFEEGIKAMGSLGIAMIGIYSFAPLMAKGLAGVIVPISNHLGIDPSVFTGCLLAPDMGGYQMAKLLAAKKVMGTFSSVIIGSTLGTTLCFTIPIAMSMISKDDYEYFSQGVLAGIITIPLGNLAGGLYMGLDSYLLILNLMPITISAVILALALFKFPGKVLKFFEYFGRGITVLSICGLILQGIDSIMNIQLIQGLAPLSESMTIVGKIALVLGGAYPMLDIVGRVFSKIFERIGESTGINAAAVCGMLGNLASNLLVFSTYKDMNPKGKVITAAFGVSAAFVIGGQMGYISSAAPDMLGAFLVAKLVGGAASIVAASWLFEREEAKYKVIRSA